MLAWLIHNLWTPGAPRHYRENISYYYIYIYTYIYNLWTPGAPRHYRENISYYYIYICRYIYNLWTPGAPRHYRENISSYYIYTYRYIYNLWTPGAPRHYACCCIARGGTRGGGVQPSQQLLRCQYLYLCTRKASKLSTWIARGGIRGGGAAEPAVPQVSASVPLYEENK